MTIHVPKERPILFSAPMVRAILAGTKTQTRRTMKPQPFTAKLEPDERFVTEEEFRINVAERRFPCPYGSPGDRLWVRERALYWTGGAAGTTDVRYAEDPEIPAFERDARTLDRARKKHPELMAGAGCWRWRPSIHMPRWACRIVLEITDVRVQALQEIDEADAQAEGITCWGAAGCGVEGGSIFATARVAYSRLWDEINGDGAWDANPWVWVVGFRRVTP